VRRGWVGKETSKSVPLGKQVPNAEPLNELTLDELG
jgi:hypothetical protein